MKNSKFIPTLLFRLTFTILCLGALLLIGVVLTTTTSPILTYVGIGLVIIIEFMLCLCWIVNPFKIN